MQTGMITRACHVNKSRRKTKPAYVLNSKPILRVIFKKPHNSTISYEFKISKIMPIKLLFRYRLIIFMYNMFRNNENLLNELAIDYDFNTRSKTKSLQLPKIKLKNWEVWCFTPVLTWCPVMLWISLTSLQKLSRGPVGSPLGRGLDSHSVASVCLWWGCPPREEEFMEQDCPNSSIRLSGNPFVLTMSLTTV